MRLLLFALLLVSAFTQTNNGFMPVPSAILYSGSSSFNPILDLSNYYIGDHMQYTVNNINISMYAESVSEKLPSFINTKEVQVPQSDNGKIITTYPIIFYTGPLSILYYGYFMDDSLFINTSSITKINFGQNCSQVLANAINSSWVALYCSYFNDYLIYVDLIGSKSITKNISAFSVPLGYPLNSKILKNGDQIYFSLFYSDNTLQILDISNPDEIKLFYKNTTNLYKSTFISENNIYYLSQNSSNFFIYLTRVKLNFTDVASSETYTLKLADYTFRSTYPFAYIATCKDIQFPNSAFKVAVVFGNYNPAPASQIQIIDWTSFYNPKVETVRYLFLFNNYINYLAVMNDFIIISTNYNISVLSRKQEQLTLTYFNFTASYNGIGYIASSNQLMLFNTTNQILINLTRPYFPLDFSKILEVNMQFGRKNTIYTALSNSIKLFESNCNGFIYNSVQSYTVEIESNETDTIIPKVAEISYTELDLDPSSIDNIESYTFTWTDQLLSINYDQNFIFFSLIKISESSFYQVMQFSNMSLLINKCNIGEKSAACNYFADISFSFTIEQLAYVQIDLMSWNLCLQSSSGLFFYTLSSSVTFVTSYSSPSISLVKSSSSQFVAFSQSSFTIFNSTNLQAPPFNIDLTSQNITSINTAQASNSSNLIVFTQAMPSNIIYLIDISQIPDTYNVFPINTEIQFDSFCISENKIIITNSQTGAFSLLDMTNIYNPISFNNQGPSALSLISSGSRLYYGTTQASENVLNCFNSRLASFSPLYTFTLQDSISSLSMISFKDFDIIAINAGNTLEFLRVLWNQDLSLSFKNLPSNGTEITPFFVNFLINSQIIYAYSISALKVIHEHIITLIPVEKISSESRNTNHPIQSVFSGTYNGTIKLTPQHLSDGQILSSLYASNGGNSNSINLTQNWFEGQQLLSMLIVQYLTSNPGAYYIYSVNGTFYAGDSTAAPSVINLPNNHSFTVKLYPYFSSEAFYLLHDEDTNEYYAYTLYSDQAQNLYIDELVSYSSCSSNGYILAKQGSSYVLISLTFQTIPYVQSLNYIQNLEFVDIACESDFSNTLFLLTADGIVVAINQGSVSNSYSINQLPNALPLSKGQSKPKWTSILVANTGTIPLLVMQEEGPLFIWQPYATSFAGSFLPPKGYKFVLSSFQLGYVTGALSIIAEPVDGEGEDLLLAYPIVFDLFNNTPIYAKKVSKEQKLVTYNYENSANFEVEFLDTNVSMAVNSVMYEMNFFENFTLANSLIFNFDSYESRYVEVRLYGNDGHSNVSYVIIPYGSSGYIGGFSVMYQVVAGLGIILVILFVYYKFTWKSGLNVIIPGNAVQPDDLILQ